ncbi:MAG: hypothetical protein II001_01610 [Bacteroidales bacterium]|nr:hypothetical protein [Bacteroidales bacterium]
MGCDIHLKLEKRVKKTLYMEKTHYGEDGKISTDIVPVPRWKGDDKWRSVRLTSDYCRSTWGDRIYGMFARLSGVRDYYTEESRRMVPDRGFPSDACDDTKLAYTCCVISDEEYNKDPERYDNSSCESYVEESRANKWVEDGVSREFPWHHGRRITGPDWHSPNWCTTEEMKKCIYDLFWNEEHQVWIGDYIEWFALLGAMEGIEKDGNYECRAVFWFDN